MRRLLIILLLFIPYSLFGVTYYVSNSGNDSWAGTSTSTPWATISKVNGASLSAGDMVLFQRGGVWREKLVPKSGSTGNYITYSAYGTGARPQFLGSEEKNSASDWQNIGGNLWESVDIFMSDVGNLIFNNNSCGTKILGVSLPTLAAQGEFWYSVSDNWVVLYSTSNPGDYYTDIECALSSHIIDFGYSKHHIVLENLDIRYGAAHGISSYSGAAYITIKDCDISYIGGGAFVDEWGDLRYGNGIQFWMSADNITIERCRVDNIYDDGITFQGVASTTKIDVSNITVAYNIVTRCEYGISYFQHGNSSSTNTNIFYQNNTVVNSGGSFGHNQRPDAKKGNGFYMSALYGYVANFNVRNNIFSGATDACIHMNSNALGQINTDYNCYYATYIAYTGTFYSSLSSWRTANGFDSHSISTDPLFLSSIDYHLTSLSPAINAGLDMGYLTDFYGSSIDANPDMGAIEYIGTSAVPTLTTTILTSIGTTSATSGGNVLSSSGSVTDRGVCWSLSVNPTVSDSHTHDGTGLGLFVSSITGLSANTTYNVRAYALNGNGYGYGENRNFTTLPVGAENFSNGLLKIGNRFIIYNGRLLRL